MSYSPSTELLPRHNSMMPFSELSSWRFADFMTKTPHSATLSPSVTGGTVLGTIFDRGTVICSDTMGSYGSLKRYTQCDRIIKVNDIAMLGAGGDVADFQFVKDILDMQVIDDENVGDGVIMQPKSLLTYLTRSLYNRRNKMDPLWNEFVVAGIQENRSQFLGMVTMTGTAFERPIIATGFGKYLALPILEDGYNRNPNMSELDAKKLLYECMRVLSYRDCRAQSKVKYGVITTDGVKIEGPYDVDTVWYAKLHGEN